MRLRIWSLGSGMTAVMPRSRSIHRRYGMDAERLVADVETGRQPPADADPVAARAAERTGQIDARARQARAETAEAAALLTEADRVDRVDNAVRADGIVDAHEAAHDLPFARSGWDEAGRREALAARRAPKASNTPARGAERTLGR